MNMTKEEYIATLKRMFKSIRSPEKQAAYNADEDSYCEGIKCNECIVHNICSCAGHSIDIAYDYVKFVEDWAKEHPAITYADKYKKLFGIDIPKKFTTDVNNPSFCPHQFGFKLECSNNKDCIECRNAFWNQEYIEPK